MPLAYRILADIVVLVHAAYVMFVVLGQVVILVGGVLGWPWVRSALFRGVHLAMILVVVIEAWCGVTCPLTVWEDSLRRLAGETRYEGDFIPHMVHNLLFYDAPPWVFNLSYTLFGCLVLATLWAVPPRWGRERRMGESGSRSQESGAA